MGQAKGFSIAPCSLVALSALLMAGCHHRQAIPTLPRVVQVPSTPPPTPDTPVMEGPPPPAISTAAPVRVTEAKPARKARRSKAKRTAVPATPVEVATVSAPPAPSPIGELSAGDEASPRKQQDAAELIATGERRLEARSAAKGAPPPGPEIKEIRHFLDGAKEALASGDLQGAVTLATKARLLLDDLEKATLR